MTVGDFITAYCSPQTADRYLRRLANVLTKEVFTKSAIEPLCNEFGITKFQLLHEVDLLEKSEQVG